MENDKLYFTEISQTNYKFYEELLPMVYRTAFRRTPEMIGLGANLGDRAVGIILFTEDPQLHLCRVLYITVDPAYRRQGIARLLVGNAEEALRELRGKNAPLVSEVVIRHGARGTMKSIYLRDPDGNLVELGFYDS